MPVHADGTLYLVGWNFGVVFLEVLHMLAKSFTNLSCFNPHTYGSDEAVDIFILAFNYQDLLGVLSPVCIRIGCRLKALPR